MTQSHSVLLFQLSMFRFNEVVNELGRPTPKPTTPNRGAWANQRALQVFKLSSNGPTGHQSARSAPPHTPGRGQSRARTSQNTAAGQCPGAPRRRPPPMGAAGPKGKQCGVRRPQDSNRTSARNRELAERRGPISGGGSRPPNVGTRPRPALLCVCVCRRPREPDHDTRPAGSGAARVRRPRAAGARAEGGRPPAAAEPDRAPAEPCR